MSYLYLHKTTSLHFKKFLCLLRDTATRCSLNLVHLRCVGSTPRNANVLSVNTNLPYRWKQVTCFGQWWGPSPDWLQKYKRKHLRGGADKSLARPGRKQATATKHEIYSTYSPRSSIHFLARCSNFCKPLKKFRLLSVQPGLRGSNDFRVWRKMATFQFFF